LILILQPLEVGEFLGAGNTPGRPDIEKDYALGINVAELVRVTGEVFQREINGLLGPRPEREEKAQPREEPYKPGGESRLKSGPLIWCGIAHSCLKSRLPICPEYISGRRPMPRRTDYPLGRITALFSLPFFSLFLFAFSFFSLSLISFSLVIDLPIL